MNNPRDWPEPIVRVQSLSDSGIYKIPDRYVKPPTERPISLGRSSLQTDVNIPIIDLQELFNDIESRRFSGLTSSVVEQISEACRNWGFFQVVNHGVPPELIDQATEVWREFFHQPMEMKQSYANSPKTYEGYGSRLGVEKAAILDWSDYYFLHYLPCSLKDQKKWPALPVYLRYVLLCHAFFLGKLLYCHILIMSFFIFSFLQLFMIFWNIIFMGSEQLGFQIVVVYWKYFEEFFFLLVRGYFVLNSCKNIQFA